MNILCVIDSLFSGGAQRQLTELALGFKDRDHDVSFLTYHHIPFYNPVIEKAQIHITCIDEPNYFKRLLKMRRFIRRGQYDSVLSFLEAPNFICEFAGIPFRKWKLVVGERNADPGILKSFKLRFFRWFHFFADYVVSNSHANMDLVCMANPLLSKSKCQVLYNVVDFNQWKYIKNFKYRKSSKLKLIIAARHEYQKNLGGFVDALAILDKKDLNKIVIDWYGNGAIDPFFDNSFLEANKKIVHYKLDKIITFHAAVEKIMEKMQDADAVGLFSFYEGLPNIICEAMACGKPVICSAVSDIPELISYDKRLLCDPADAHSIKDTMSYLISLSDDELNQIGLKNLAIAKEEFNKDDIISKYLMLLKND